jgi:anthranilate/para-aminobenzoate synthase component I
MEKRSTFVALYRYNNTKKQTSMYTFTARLPYADALPMYRTINGGTPSCLFESASAVDKSSRLSVVGFDPILELTGKEDRLDVRLLRPRGEVWFDFLRKTYADAIELDKDGRLLLHLPKQAFRGREEERLERPNIAQPLRRMLKAFQTAEKNYMGFYGAFAYNFAYLFEDVEQKKPIQEPDFHLFLFDNVLVFNHLTQDLTLYLTRVGKEEAERDAPSVLEGLATRQPEAREPLQIGKFVVTPDDELFQKQVAAGIELCNRGELLEIVLSRKLTAQVQGDLLKLYERYKAINPSPYLFYFDFGAETLLGASPELMLRYEQGRATIRPISGSVRRSKDPIEDHQLMMQLLNDPKENAELDMLIDLGRNDLARICQPGIEIDHYRIVEKYAHVTHTVAQLSGVLQPRYSGFDALISSLNAGTLTGAPKVAAMQHIESIEQHSRGYYGGCIGWLLFNGDVNTAITIRTAHVRDGLMSYCTGATILYESVPANELKETAIKSGSFLEAVADYS